MLRKLLFPFAILFGIGITIRSLLFRFKILKSVQFSFPVISVGNLTTGGTGKTPHIEYLIRLLQEHYKVATLSRGYRRKTRGFILADKQSTAETIGDEPLQFYKKFDGINVCTCENRLTGIPQLLAACPETEIILLDDAYQHRAVKPGLNILLVDYNRPYFEDYLLPMGNLRECRYAKSRANIIVVSKTPESITEQDKEVFRKKLKTAPHQRVFFSSIQYNDTCIDLFTNKAVNLNRDNHVILLTGIANNCNLLAHLQKITPHIQTKAFTDHHNYTPADMGILQQLYQNLPKANRYIVTTEKDAMRLFPFKDFLETHQIAVVYLPIKIDIPVDSACFNKLVLDYLSKYH